MHFTNQGEMVNALFENTNLEQTRDMSAYPSLLTPPSESPETIQALSPNSGYLYTNMKGQGYVSRYGMGSPQSFGTANAHIKILEQPIERFRFRYKSEMAGTHGSLTGRATDRNRKQTYPAIQLCNYNKPAIVRCSVYQHSSDEYADSQPHAHRLVRKSGFTEMDDPHDVSVSADNDYIAGFHSMGIIHTARKNIISELVRKKAILKAEEIAREEGRKRQLTADELLDIQNSAEAESKKINLNIVRLRFDAFEERNGILYPICPPVYSNTINNLKSALTGDLKIVRMDHCTSPCRGGKEIFILVEKVTKKNIKIRFFELDEEETVWEDYGKFTDLDVHHQYAIVFRTPPYRDLNIENHVKVYMELVRPSDGARSEAKEFTYIPCDPVTGRKRPRTYYSSSSSYNSLYGTNNIPLTIPGHTEAENNILQEAFEMNDFNSSDFEKIYNMFKDQYTLDDLTKLEDVDLQHLVTDAVYPQTEETGNERSGKMQRFEHTATFPESTDSRLLNDDEKKILSRVYQELCSFLQTNPTTERKSKTLLFLFKKFRSENEDSALHLALYGYVQKCLALFMKLLNENPHPAILNSKNKNGDTPLHVAVQTGVVRLVDFLVSLKADLSLQNNEGNTPLHLAVSKQTNNPLKKQINTHIVKFLLKDESEIKKFIDIENNAGDTALTIAIQTKNLEAVRILCWRGADVNKHHKKNGFTALHIAVNEQSYEIVSFLLDNNFAELNCNYDFKDCTPYQLASSLRESSYNSRRIFEKIEDYMRKNGLSETVEIKEEFQVSDEEPEIKFEPMSPSDVTSFTPECLDEVAAILDKSGNWQHLADLLDLGHFSRIEDVQNYKSPSKSLLNLAIRNGESILQIREFLENLNEFKAVEAIDRMVKTEKDQV